MPEETPKLASYKRIILCSDGTWLASDTGDKSTPSNVAKLARAVANNGPDAKGNIVKQIVSYHSGLGSGDLPFQKAIYGGFGWGLDIEVSQIYDFISNNYEPGDELFFFGFSRGAFTVRSVAGLVCDVGVLSAVHMSRFTEMWEAYRANTSGEPFRNSAWYRNNKEELGLTDVRVKVVGVWDTVGALGIPEWPVVSWATKAGLPINMRYAFHNTKVSENLDYAFQALAIDEKRLTFPPTLWHKTADGPAKDLQQCWFPGVDNLSNMLTFEDAAIKILIKEHHRALNSINIPSGWGCGPIVDNFSGLQGLFFWLLGKKDREPGSYPRDPGDGTSGATNEYFHPITRIRKEILGYNPMPLRGYSIERPHGSAGWKWVKSGVQSIPEYVMHPEKKMSVAYEENGRVKYRVESSLSRLLCPENILLDLDRDNGI
ncbi:hypothetical protein FOVG_17361 [Fusarium oxysporum f. sp. pisi HDV247]|uniref:T6SS Phospholipase effector Tle1-like catalytic domain-containing protein n=1 Tax=Fusarium oxysporum f. sp. pisi HDV247 TaxID=1080344 RepID=W9NEW8_FUSOX|nr:hypothetical protein FOVG_17361 [Fusarium oxysporum f. sp. pisi HDV247]